MAKKRRKTIKRKRHGSRAGHSTMDLIISAGTGFATYLAANYITNMLKGDDTIDKAGLKILAPQGAAVVAGATILPKDYALPVIIGGLISLAETYLAMNPDKKAKVVKTGFLIAGEDEMEPTIDISDLTPEQQNLLGSKMKQIASQRMNGNDWSMSGKDNWSMSGGVSDPLSGGVSDPLS